MPLGPTLSADDFEQVPRGPRLFDSWRARRPIDNPVGPFAIDLNVPPDAEVLRHVNDLVRVASEEYDAIINLVYEHYLRFADDKHWMQGCGVPRRLREDRVTRYLRSRSISVRRDRHGHVTGNIHITPQWDEEHGIQLGLEGGRLVPQPP